MVSSLPREAEEQIPERCYPVRSLLGKGRAMGKSVTVLPTRSGDGKPCRGIIPESYGLLPQTWSKSRSPYRLQSLPESPFNHSRS